MPPKPNDVISAISSQTPSMSSPVLPKSQPAMMGNDKGKGKKKPVQSKDKVTPQKQELSDDAKLMNKQKLIYGTPIRNAENPTEPVDRINNLVDELQKEGLGSNYPGQGDEYRTAVMGYFAPKLKTEEYNAITNKYLSEAGKPVTATEADSKEKRIYASKGNPREHFAKLAEAMIENAMDLGIKTEAEFIAKKDKIFTEEMKSPYFEKQGYYGNLFPTVARLYQKKMANFKPIGNEDARTIREEENRRLLQSPKSAVSTESIRQVEEAAKGVLPKSSQ